MRVTRRDRRTARQLYRLCLVVGVLDEPRARAVVQHVIGSRRRGRLGVLSHFHRLVRLDRDRHTAQVESAVPLPPDVRVRVQSGLAGTFGEGVEATFTENEALIGGMRVQVGSAVYDGSVRSRLASIEARL